MDETFSEKVAWKEDLREVSGRAVCVQGGHVSFREERAQRPWCQSLLGVQGTAGIPAGARGTDESEGDERRMGADDES